VSGTNKNARSALTGGLSIFYFRSGLSVSPPRHGMPMMMAAVMMDGEHET